MTTHKEEVRALLSAATPGPWHAWDRGIGFEVHQGGVHIEWTEHGGNCRELNNEFRETFRQPDAALIARAPELLAALCDKLDEAEGEVARLTQWKAEAMQVMSGLQELGQALGLGWGVRITGDHAAEVARDLRERAEKAEAAIEKAAGFAWDEGNAVGLDGWVGPGRGAGEPDSHALYARERDVQRAIKYALGGES